MNILKDHSFSKKTILSWCLYDWAHSAYPTLVITFIFATYFTESVAKNNIIGTAQWGDAIAISGILIVILSPLTGAFADYLGKKKPWLLLFTYLMIISAGLLWFILPSHRYTFHMLTLVIVGTVALETGAVFYNALLADISPKKIIGRISGWGWGLGYMGGLCALLIALLLFINQHTSPFAFNHQTAEQVRICGPFVAIWIAVFSIPIFINVKETPHQVLNKNLLSPLQSLWQVLKSLRYKRSILIFLIAHMFYIDGLNTLFAFGGIYAAGTFQFSFSEVLIFGIAINVTAGLGAASFAFLDDWIGSKKTILIAILCLLISGIAVLIVHQVLYFWILGLFLGLFVGPIQAASRTYLSNIAPKQIRTELFGLYALTGKATAFLNPWIVGLMTEYFQSQRIGMSSIFVFVFMGGVLLLFCDDNSLMLRT